MSMLFHNIRSARGPGLEMLEVEMRRWGVKWDIVGLAETWLDSESERRITVKGFKVLCASRKLKSGGGVALLLREGIVYRERADLSTFVEGETESLFVEIIRGGGQRNVVIGVVYRPPSGDLTRFNESMASILSKVGNVNTYILGDFNIDLLKSGGHRPTSDYLEGFYSRGFYPLISLPTRLTDLTATLIDNIWTNNLEKHIKSGLVTVRVSDHLPIYSLVGGTHGRLFRPISGLMFTFANQQTIPLRRNESCHTVYKPNLVQVHRMESNAQPKNLDDGSEPTRPPTHFRSWTQNDLFIS